MKEVMDFISLYRLWISAVIATIVLILLIIKFWDNIKFWWLCTWTSFPLIGTIARSYKQTSLDNSGWFASENIICSKFYSFYAKYMNADRKFFEDCQSYLEKAQEDGRKEFPALMWIVIFLLVVAEAMGFAYVLAGYTIPGASESLQQKGAVAIAFVISIILVGFTHLTGGEIYKNSLVTKARKWYNSDREKSENDNLVPDSGVMLSANDKDNNKPGWKKLINRLNTNADVTPKWYITIITGILIVLIAVGATYVRGQVLEKQLNQEISNISTNVYESTPAELSQIQANTDKKALIEQQEADKKGGWATFIILAVLFVFIQILGILFGKIWGFAGKESAKAYRFTKDYDTADAFVEAYEKKKEAIITKADAKLKVLRSKMSDYISKVGIDKKGQDASRSAEDRNFSNYIAMKIEDKKDRMKREKSLSQYNKSLENDDTESAEAAPIKENATKQPQPAMQNTQSLEPKKPATSVDLKEVQERVDELNDLIEAQISKGDVADMAKLEKYKAELNKNLEILIDQTKAEIADKLARNESFDELNEKLKEQLSMLKMED